MYDYLTISRLKDGINEALSVDDASRVVDLVVSLDTELRYGRMSKNLTTPPAKPQPSKPARRNQRKQ